MGEVWEQRMREQAARETRSGDACRRRKRGVRIVDPQALVEHLYGASMEHMSEQRRAGYREALRDVLTEVARFEYVHETGTGELMRGTVGSSLLQVPAVEDWEWPILRIAKGDD